MEVVVVVVGAAEVGVDSRLEAEDFRLGAVDSHPEVDAVAAAVVAGAGVEEWAAAVVGEVDGEVGVVDAVVEEAVWVVARRWLLSHIVTKVIRVVFNLIT